MSKLSLSLPLVCLLTSSFMNGQGGMQVQAPPQQQLQSNRSAQPSQPNERTSLAVAPEGVSKMKLVPGTLVTVRVFEETDLDGTYRVDEQGNIALPLAGTVYLAEVTLRQAEAAIRAKLISAEILKDPHVIVNLDEYSASDVVVTGEVTSPGRFPILGPRKLMDVLAMAGGETSLSGNEIVVHRLGQPANVTESIHNAPDTSNTNALSVEINPGDSVMVKKAGLIYVLGSVNRPGGYVMQSAGELNLAQAMALAFGTGPDASIGNIRIIRKAPDGQLLQIPAQYDKFRKGQTAPMVLQAEDIVYVPSSALKSIFINARSELSAASAATIYAAR